MNENLLKELDLSTENQASFQNPNGDNKNLLFPAGQNDFSESRRMSFKALKVYNEKFSAVGRIIKAALGGKFYEKFLKDDELWSVLNDVEIDILINSRAFISEAEARSFL